MRSTLNLSPLRPGPNLTRATSGRVTLTGITVAAIAVVVSVLVAGAMTGLALAEGRGANGGAELDLSPADITDRSFSADAARLLDGRLAPQIGFSWRNSSNPWADASYPTSATISNAVAALCHRLVTDGIALIGRVPTEPGQVLRMAELWAMSARPTTAGCSTWWPSPEPVNMAYSPVGLPLHTDNPYREPCPTVQLLHCLASADDGGASLFADGRLVAERLRRDEPEHFEAPATTPVLFRYHGGRDDRGRPVDLRAVRPIIELDPTGRVRAVSVNDRSMEPPGLDTIDGNTGRHGTAGVERFYAAYRCFHDSSPDAMR